MWEVANTKSQIFCGCTRHKQLMHGDVLHGQYTPRVKILPSIVSKHLMCAHMIHVKGTKTHILHVECYKPHTLNT